MKDRRKLCRQHLNISLPNLEHRCLPNIVSAELAKVIENSYRMVNIALVSEFADFASQIGADLVGILESIRARPTHSNIRFAESGTWWILLNQGSPIFI